MLLFESIPLQMGSFQHIFKGFNYKNNLVETRRKCFGWEGGVGLGKQTNNKQEMKSLSHRQTSLRNVGLIHLTLYLTWK